MGDAGTGDTTSVTMSTGAFTRTESGYCPIATRSINCGEGSADVRAARAAKTKVVYIMIVISILNESWGFSKDLASEMMLRSKTSYTILRVEQNLEKSPGGHAFIASNLSGSISSVTLPSLLASHNYYCQHRVG